MEHPVITNMERTGYPDGKEPKEPHCPICGSECEIIYMDKDGEIFACDECLKKKSAYFCEECF